MSPQDSLAIYLGGLEASVRIHLLGAQHVSTLEPAQVETRIYANAHRGFGVRASGQYETVDNPRDLMVQMPVVRQAVLAPPYQRMSVGFKCFKCGRMGHIRDTCPVPRRARSPLPAGGYGSHTTTGVAQHGLLPSRECGTAMLCVWRFGPSGERLSFTCGWSWCSPTSTAVPTSGVCVDIPSGRGP